jgi:hypothetical protein
MACTLDGLTHFTLVLQRCSGEAAGQNLTLLIHKPEQKTAILIFNLFNAVLLEPAIFFLRRINRGRVEITYFILCAHRSFF